MASPLPLLVIVIQSSLVQFEVSCSNSKEWLCINQQLIILSPMDKLRLSTNALGLIYDVCVVSSLLLGPTGCP